jgi:mannose-6-phosphate isomerase-like protein (cupin superfamily)
MNKCMIEDTTRRNFLRVAPAAAAGISLTDGALSAAQARAQSSTPIAPVAFQLIRAQTIHDGIEALQKQPGNTSLVDSGTLPFTVVLAVEVSYREDQFEWHENQDHIFHILDGTTVYEIGGTPKDGRMTDPGEWRAAESEGAITVKLNKGDMLVIPRGTPHRQSTPETVTFMLISPGGVVKA